MVDSPLPLRIYKISQGFGEHPEVYKQFGHLGHNGIDFAPKWGSDRTIYAPHDGYIKLHLNDAGYGNYIELKSLPRKADGTGHKSDLAHMEKFLVPDGTFVSLGEPIGIMGTTGFSTGTHLHWTYKITVNGVTVNTANGYNGALDIGKYVRTWTTSPLIS